MPKTIPIVTRPIRIMGLLRMLSTETDSKKVSFIKQTQQQKQKHKRQESEGIVSRLTRWSLHEENLATQRLDAENPRRLALALHRHLLALVRPLVAAERLPGLDGAILADVDAQRLEGVCGAVHVEQVRVGRDVVEAEGVDHGQRGVEALVQAGQRGVGAGREEEGVRLGGEGDGEGDLGGGGGGGAEDCAGEDGEEGWELHCGGGFFLLGG